MISEENRLKSVVWAWGGQILFHHTPDPCLNVSREDTIAKIQNCNFCGLDSTFYVPYIHFVYFACCTSGISPLFLRRGKALVTGGGVWQSLTATNGGGKGISHLLTVADKVGGVRSPELVSRHM